MIERVDPIILFVKDFRRSLAFYRDVLEMRIESLESVHGEFATFRLGNAVFGIHGGYKGKKGGPIDIHFETNDIHKTVAVLKERGVTFSAPIEKMPWGVHETSFLDPDGNEFDLTEPTAP